MKHKLLLILSFFCIFVSATAQQNPKALIKKVVNKYKAASSISFTVDHTYRQYDDEGIGKEYEDPLKSDYRIVINKKDTLFGKYFWFNIEDPERGDYCQYYNNNEAYYIDYGQKEAKKLDLVENAHFFISDYSDEQYISSLFTKPDTIRKILNNRKYEVSYKDTIIDKSDFLVATAVLPNDSPICCLEKTLTFFFNKKTENLEKASYMTNQLGTYYVSDWNFSTITLNKETSATLHDVFKKTTKDYTPTDYILSTSRNSTPVQNGTPAPIFTGKSYPDLKEVSLTDYKGKIVVLHFWYMARGWYTEQIPALNNIQQKYKNGVVVLGINPFDSDEERLEKMPAFIKKHSMMYPIVFTGRSVLKPYNLFLGRTIYVIDQNGIIRHSDWGTKSLEQSLDKEIQTLLKK